MNTFKPDQLVQACALDSNAE